MHRLTCDNCFIISTYSFLNLPEKEIMYKIFTFQSTKDFKTRYVLTIKHISTVKENLKLLPNTRINLSSNRLQILQKQQFLNNVDKNLNKEKKI